MSNYIAWIGAVTGMLALGWNIFIWLRSGPRIIFKVMPHACYLDAKVKETIRDEQGGEIKTLETYCHVEVINRGNLATTLLNIKVEGNLGSNKAFFDKSRFEPNFGQSLPHVLAPGRIWSCRFEESLLKSITSRKEECNFMLYTSCRNRPFTRKLKIRKEDKL